MKPRTTQEDRDALRKYFVDLIVEDADRLPPRRTREKFILQVLLDCQDAIDLVESIENRLSHALDGISAAQSCVTSLLTEIRR